ncbi:MAG: PD-(D/E)XK nuclease family protein [Nitrososphaerota archaeon]|nr:PD-(D/E)XK nuclease family protein [Nitrososphaerota archaeon]
MEEWKKSMSEPLAAGKAYRFDQSFVAVSSIAQQYYCEAKVEQSYVHGDIPSEAKEAGTNLHEEVLAMEKVELKDLVERVEKAPLLTASFGVHGRILDIDVAGMPDAVVFEKSVPKWVIELKTTKGDPTKLWDDQLVQVRVYGLLMEKMGFDCSRMQLALVRWRQEDIKRPQKEEMLSRITRSLMNGETKELEAKFGMRFFVFPHDAAEAERAVAWAQGYWLGRRGAVPSSSPGKCKICEYSAICPYSLVKFGPNSTVERRVLPRSTRGTGPGSSSRTWGNSSPVHR